MLYPLKYTHVHPDYCHNERLIIEKDMSPDIKILYNAHKDHEIEVNGHSYMKNPFDYVDVKDIKCSCDNKILYEQLFGAIDDQPDDVMAYKSCKHTIFAAAKRQMKMAPTPDPHVADDFLQYAKNIIENEVGEYLTHFGYSYQQWFDHLDRGKQLDMEMTANYMHHNIEHLTPAQIRRIEQIHYEGICKVELQATNGKPRMVCSIPLQTKFIMGPVCWALEEIFQEHLRGYCGGKNLTQMAEKINHYAALGFTKVVEGDGSAFDNTQDITLKRVDHYIYNRIKDKIYHVDKDLFYKTATQPYKTMDVVAMDADTKKKQKLFTYSILGSVFSGDCDTTLCNTIRMDLYNRYVNDKAGLVYGQDYIAFSKGDDFTIMYKPYVDNDFINKSYYKYFVKALDDPKQADTRVYGLGQVLKMLDFGDLSSIKFCSLRAWYKNATDIILTRDPAKFYSISKYSRKIKTMNNYQAASYCMQQAEALLVSYSKLHIFETMADAYMLKAAEYMKHSTLNQQQAFSKKFARLERRLENLKKKSCTNTMMEENVIERLIYNIKMRKTSFKIFGNYWENMQHIERVRTDILSDAEAEYINQQISAEFKTEELRSVLGLK